MSRASVGLGLVVALAAACGVDEQPGFLLGRLCDPNLANDCDDGQACLPHEWRGGRTFTDFKCRDVASIRAVDSPLAYCDERYPCPGELVCNADRVRIDASVRPRVCKSKDDLFSPPFDGGV